jgi:hypothetical protein
MVYSELLNSVSDLLGWGQIAAITEVPSDEFRKIIRATNSVLKAMQLDKDWPELRTEGAISIAAPGTTDVVFSEGSNLLALHGTPTTHFHNTDIGKLVLIPTYNEYYTITAYINQNLVTIDRVWPHASEEVDAIEFGFNYYSLPSTYDRVLSGEMTNRVTGVIKDNGSTFATVSPMYFTVHGLDSSGNSKVHFDSLFPVVTSVEYSYQMKHPTIAMGSQTTDGNILYPERYTLYIVDQIVAKLTRDVENSAAVQQQASDAYREAMRANSSPGTGRERTVMVSCALRHGAYRRR